MKTTLSGWLLGGLTVFTLAACNTTPMNSDSSMGSSGAGTTGTSGNTSSTAPSERGDSPPRASTPVNCTTNTTAADGTTVAGTPGMACPTEMH